MLRTTTAAAVAMILIAAAAHATVIEIPLPGLLGAYPIDESNATRTVTVVLPQAPTAIHGASFRVSGTTEVGFTTCDLGELLRYPWPIDLYVSMVAEPGGFWLASDYASMPHASGPFAWTADFHGTPNGTTWALLMDGVADISLHGAPALLVGLCFPPMSPPTAVVTEAVLIIDAEFPIPVEPSTWGRIKALYRDR